MALSGRKILEDAKNLANDRQHEVWMHVLEICKKDKFKHDRSHYPLHAYVELKLRKHRIKKQLENDYWWEMQSLYGRSVSVAEMEAQIEVIELQLEEIRSKRDHIESRWESYLP